MGFLNWIVPLFFLLGQFTTSADRICQIFKFVINEDVIPDHALEEHVFKTLTVDKVTNCHMMCRDDCRCISMNYMHNKQRDNCQLNDVNKEMNPSALKFKPGASYYDLVREYQVNKRSFVQGRDSCNNRCCQTNPCLQGGTCREICDPTTVRFNCTCPENYIGERCEIIKPRSCKDLTSNGVKKSGMHFLYDSQNNRFPVYCDFDSEVNYTWALIQSFSLGNNNMFTGYRFAIDHPINGDKGVINWHAYRLSLSHTQSIANASTHLRATCNFPDDGLVYTDYARAKLDGHDLFGQWSAQCRAYEVVNIRGFKCQECTAATWQPTAWHIDSSANTGCQFNGRNGAVSSEDNFGFYSSTNPAFRCTSNQNATTQFWIGSKLSG